MTHAGPLVVIGDALLDRDLDGTASPLCPDAPAPVLDDLIETRRPGGAALAALLASGDGHPVLLIAPFGDDPASVTVRGLLEPHVTVVPVPLDGPLPDKARFRAGGQVLLRADGPARPGPATREAAEAIASAGTLLVSDYGRGVTADERIRTALAGRAARVPLVWDPHPRGAVPVPGTRLATPNHREARAAAVGPGPPPGGPQPPGPARGGPRPGAALRGRGRRPAAQPLACRRRGRHPGPARHAPRPGQPRPADRARPAGAGRGHLRGRGPLRGRSRGGPGRRRPAVGGRGDRDRSRDRLPGRGRRGPAPTRGRRGHRPAGARHTAGSATAAGGGAEDPVALAARIHAGGGTVVAAGGCFDVLHAGHVSLLQAARSLGDCLIVCLNSDESVRRLKGAGRPLTPAADRVALLSALHCVDAVLVFGEDTPRAALQRLRPDLWVKGGDYEGQILPETDLLSSWGGQAVTVPYLAGRSTTRLQAAGAAAVLGADQR